MSELPDEMFQQWTHSYEEDASGVTVFRPNEYDLPPARGRDGIEFRADGTFVDWPIGPADVSRAIDGRWRIEEPGRVRISFQGDIRPSRIIEIIECNAQVLKVRQQVISSPTSCHTG